MITSLATALSALALVLAPPVPSVATEDPAPCSSRPYGVRGCEDYLGRVVREREGVQMPSLTDRELGRVIQRLCFGEPFPAIIASGTQSEQRELKYNLSYLDSIKGPYCG
jgi:hypothetical protein